MKKEKRSIKRKFLGNILNPTAFDKKHLKAYLKGYTMFTFGKNLNGTIKSHMVEQELYDINNKQDTPVLKEIKK